MTMKTYLIKRYDQDCWVLEAFADEAGTTDAEQGLPDDVHAAVMDMAHHSSEPHNPKELTVDGVRWRVEWIRYDLRNDLVLRTSANGWSLHAPGSTDKQIERGDAPYLVRGTGARPSEADYEVAAIELALNNDK